MHEGLVTSWTVALPDAVVRLAERWEPGGDAADRMRLAVDLSDAGSRAGLGGPFGAAVFDESTGELLAVGVNLVLARRCSVVHAEIVATMLAQERLGTHDLRERADAALYTSCEPCAMCLGSIPWAGYRAVRFAAASPVAEEVGFDEGRKPDRWESRFDEVGIAVEGGLLRDEAERVLQEYAARGGPLY